MNPSDAIPYTDTLHSAVKNTTLLHRNKTGIASVDSNLKQLMNTNSHLPKKQDEK